MNIKLAILLSAMMPLLAACSTPEGDYPSLMVRDAERFSGTMEPAAAEPYVAPATPAAVLSELNQLASDAEMAHQAFLKEAPRTTSTLAATRGDEMGTPGWSRAQIALGSLEAARSHTLIALADLDRLYVTAATEGRKIDEIEAARTQAAALVEEEDRMISALAYPSIGPAS